LNKFNIDKTDTVELIVLSVVSFSVLFYIMIFTVNKRKSIADFLAALSRHINKRDTHSTPDVSDIEEELEIVVESSSRTASIEENYLTAEQDQHSRNQVQTILESRSNVTGDINNGRRMTSQESNSVPGNME